MIYTPEAIKIKKEKRAKIKNKIFIIVCVIVIPLLLYNISLIIQSIVNPEETPSFFGVKTFIIISGSMEPNLEIGDVIIVKQAENYEVGDIISFRQGQSVITHRVTKIEENDGETRYRTKGDNNNTEDSGTITADVIEGKVVKTIPYLRKNIVFIKRQNNNYCNFNFTIYLYIT